MNFLTKIILIPSLTLFVQFSFSQEADNRPSTDKEAQTPAFFGTTITVTTKGISTIPSLTLGKPAAIFEMEMGKKRLSFEPKFRFGLDGKPWSFQFWWRYQLIQKEKFNLNVGARPNFTFKTKTATINGVTDDVIVSQRNLGGEVAPSYYITKKISISPYYLYLYGVDRNMTKHTNFFALRTNFSNMSVSDQFSISITPQIYYLKIDSADGFYFASTLSLQKQNFPFSVSTMFNQKIKSDIAGGQDFLWNVSLIYSFNKQFIKKQ